MHFINLWNKINRNCAIERNVELNYKHSRTYKEGKLQTVQFLWTVSNSLVKEKISKKESYSLKCSSPWWCSLVITVFWTWVYRSKVVLFEYMLLKIIWTNQFHANTIQTKVGWLMSLCVQISFEVQQKLTLAQIHHQNFLNKWRTTAIQHFYAIVTFSLQVYWFTANSLIKTVNKEHEKAYHSVVTNLLICACHSFLFQFSL